MRQIIINMENILHKFTRHHESISTFPCVCVCVCVHTYVCTNSSSKCMQLRLLGLKKTCWGRVVALARDKYVCRSCIAGYSFVFHNNSRCFGFFSFSESRRFPLLCQKQGRAALRASGCALSTHSLDMLLHKSI